MVRRVVLICMVVGLAWVGRPVEAGESLLPPDTLQPELGPGQKRFPYVNPVYPADAPDPALLRVGDYFYAAVTGEKILRSKDLVHWESVGNFFGSRYPAWVDPVSPEIWAPELQYIDGKYLLYFSARVRGHASLHRGIGVAWSDRPEGPYTGAEKPLVSGPGFRHIDQQLFRDDDGTWYMYWGSDHHPIHVQQVSPDGLSLVGEARAALEPLPHLRYSRLVEGPWVIKRGDYYYMFWSGDNFIPGEYAMSVGRATSPWGPFERYFDNPILVGDLTWASPGHNAIIQDDAGQDWVLYHAYDWTDTGIGRMLLLDPLVWRDGWPRIVGRRPSVGLVAQGPVWESSAVPLIEVAQGKSVEASSSRPGYWAELAVDGETRSSWLPSPDDEDPWLIIDLGESRRIGKVSLRFGKGHNHRYQIYVSQDAREWELVADRSRVPVHPPEEALEATARYVRISLTGPVQSDHSALRQVRVFAYESVWIESPALTRVPTPFEIRVNVDPALSPKRVTVALDGEAIYSAPAPPSGPITSPYLPDGAHQLTLEVVDQRDAVWRHDVRLTVANAMIVHPEHGANLRGESIVRFRAGSPPWAEARVTMAPIRNGEVFVDETITLYRKGRVPESLVVDTEAYPDGTYQLKFEVETERGDVSTAATVVIIKNWERLGDDFEPPHSSSWFGTIERKKTIGESKGWEYETTDPSTFHGDRDRRIWTGEGTGHLVWEAPGELHGVRVVLYSRGADLRRLQLSASPDQATWAPLVWERSEPSAGAGGWAKVELTGVAGEGSRFLRLSLPAELGPDRLQLGYVELLYRQPRHET